MQSVVQEGIQLGKQAVMQLVTTFGMQMIRHPVMQAVTQMVMQMVPHLAINQPGNKTGHAICHANEYTIGAGSVGGDGRAAVHGRELTLRQRGSTTRPRGLGLRNGGKARTSDVLMCWLRCLYAMMATSRWPPGAAFHQNASSLDVNSLPNSLPTRGTPHGCKPNSSSAHGRNRTPYGIGSAPSSQQRGDH
eukprot:gene11163-biopygen18377